MSSINPVDELFFLIETKATSRTAVERVASLVTTLHEDDFSRRNTQVGRLNLPDMRNILSCFSL